MECQGKWRTERYSGKNNPTYKGKVDCVCKQCGKPFIEYPSRVADGRGVFCCKSCFNQWKRENTDGTKFSWYKGGPVTVKCSWCGNDLQRKISEVESRTDFFCNNTCQSAWRRIHQTGEKAHNYRYGINYGGYHYTFHRPAERDGLLKFYKYTCMMCGKVHIDAPLKPDIHHIDPREKSIPIHELKSGLVVLCHPCHQSLKNKSNFKYWTEYFSMLINLCGGWDIIYNHIDEHYKLKLTASL